ncbi:hypothetical protein BDZ97DRAFT_1761441 [Flammula alnicola]|nr:hypothetical protein BDZ97DRAFT_1761441 [Flammula alnicola]
MSATKLSLMCLIWPDDMPNRHLATVTIEDDATVMRLKEMIKSLYPRRLHNVDVCDLVPWRCSIPVDDNLQETLDTIQFDGTDTKLHPLPPMSEISEHFATGLARTTIHILVEIRDHNLHLTSLYIRDLQRLHIYLWGQDRVTVVSTAGKSYSYIDLTFFHFKLNVRPDNILLIREEYILAYKTILADTLRQPPSGHRRSATLVTGQPGIGKTLFLFYVLARRLEKKEFVALQINSGQFALFGEHGVSLHSSECDHVPRGAWALFDSSGQADGLCGAFHCPDAHVIHTSSPASYCWKDWVKNLSANTYIMDVWLEEEFRILLTICHLNVQRGLALFERFGPSPKIIIDILITPRLEATHVRNIRAGAVKLASQFSTVFLDLNCLDFSSDISSKIFTVRPDISNGLPTLYIPTPFLSSSLGIAMSRQAAALQHTFFNMLRGHPSLCSAAGWLFESYAHVYFSNPNHVPIQAYLRNDPNPYPIPTPAKMITGSKLKTIQPPHNFYWRPREPNFEGVDAVIRVGNIVWALQFTISALHRSAAAGLAQVLADMNHKRGVEWRLVMVGSERCNAESARDRQKLEGNWKKTPIYVCELPLGKFTDDEEERLQDILKKTKNTYPVDQRLGLGE